ncbi:hypothetical protein EV421DRAFT_1685318, partial [Armillaria borealis]
DGQHSTRGRCGCIACRHTREQLGCQSPRKCFQKAKTLLEALPSKWDPCTCPPPEIPDDNETDDESDENISMFRPHMITRGTVADMFRIFAEG